MSGPVPTFKLEGTDNAHIKVEDVLPESPTALSDAYMDDGDLDDPALNFDNMGQQLWMSRLPKYLWETLVKMGDPKAIDQALANIPDDQEIDLGVIRVEGDTERPDRVSLRLNDIPYFQNVEKEYILKTQTGTARRGKRPGEVFLFSEKNKDGYKQRSNVWDNLDEDGNPTMRSQLFNEVLRDEKRKENKGKYKPRAKRPIPKITALAGTVTQEYDTVPVENSEHKRFEQQRTSELLKPKEVEETGIATVDSRIMFGSILTAAERQSINKQAQAKRQLAKDSRTARLEKPILLEMLFQQFRQHKYWGLRDLRHILAQPEQWIKEVLEEIAVMHRAGDFNGKWELRDDFKSDASLLNAVGEAPKMEDSDVDMKSDDDDDDVQFEDV